MNPSPPGSESTMSSSSPALASAPTPTPTPAAAPAPAVAPAPAPVGVNNAAASSRHAHSRTQSVSSDRPSTIAHSLMSPPLPVSPEAAFIAASAASQIVTNDHDGHSETWYDQAGVEPSGETALVSPGALQLANSFVDQLLFNIIGVAGSTSLSALRPAVSEVLKPKLAKDAVNQADEELREYLGGGEVDDLARPPGAVSSRDWDLELAWKRTRLRCMVYSSLGDVEEEDEDYYMEQEHLRGESDDILTETVSPAVAIFLTSILEFMGEQVLVISGQAAFNRLRVKYEKELKDGSRSPGDVAERLVVEELDMERVALDRTLGRLWRAWKKRIRSPTEPNFSRPFSRSSIGASSVPHTRQGSVTTVTDRCFSTVLLEDSSPEEEETKSEEETQLDGGNEKDEAVEANASAIPLPMSDNDIAEIEVPGLVSYSDDESSDEDEDDDDDVIRRRRRPKSSIVLFRPSEIEPPTPTMSEPHTPAEPRRQRANSLPTPAASPYKSPSIGSPVIAQPASQEQAHENLNKDETTADAQAMAVSGQTPSAGTTTEIVQDNTTTAPTRNLPRTEADEGEIDDFEEPQILTSSRISIGGRSSSPAISDAGIARPPSILIARSNSVGSARIIHVQSPRSPSMGSRTGSWEMDHNRSTDISREGSITAPTPPIPEEYDQDLPSAAAQKRSGFVPPPHEHLDVSIVSAPLPRSRSPPKSVPSQAPIPAPIATKVTILNAPTPRSSSLPQHQQPQDHYDIPHKSNYRNSPLPTLPERSAGRPVPGQANTTTVAVTPQRGSPEPPKVQRPKQTDSPSSTTSNKLRNFRSSSESSSTRPEDVARHFEELIHSDQTLQYTLTPESMRDGSSSISSRSIKDGISPVASHRAQKSEDVKPTQRSRSSSFKRSLSISKATGLSSHPPTDVLISGKHTGPGSKPPVSMPMKSRPGPLARDARVPPDSTQDFAEFIRGTGPQGAGTPPTRVRTGSVANARNNSPPAFLSRSASTATRPSTGPAPRTRLQARDATTSSNGSSELIDFIRRGPQDMNSSNPRIPRHVAPFRTTMDSDQMQMSGAAGGKAIDAILPNIRDSRTSTNFTETSAPSSMNSQSALLSKSNKAAAAPYAGNNFDDGDMVPKRTQRRVRDPYAIDLSEEDDDFDILPKPKLKPKKEESLIDFLNNYEPPPEPEAKPVIPPKQLPKKKSAPNLISRLRSAGGYSSNGSFSGLSRKMSNLDSRSLHSRASTTRGFTPITVNIPPNADKLGTDFIASSPRLPTTSSRRVPMKRFEPRDAHSSTTRTSDLASFLRDSEPPPSAMAPPMSHTTEEKTSSGFSRMFERRKKSTVF